MANGKITLGKQSGGTLGLVFPDGVSNTEVVLPESGELVTKEYVDNGAGATFVANDTRVKTALNASGGAPIYACRAWVNFDGNGTVAIRANGNVSSVIDNGIGDYTVNFIDAMPDANYTISTTVGNLDSISNSKILVVKSSVPPTSLFVRLECHGASNGAFSDDSRCNVIIIS